MVAVFHGTASSHRPSSPPTVGSPREHRDTNLGSRFTFVCDNCGASSSHLATLIPVAGVVLTVILAAATCWSAAATRASTAATEKSATAAEDAVKAANAEASATVRLAQLGQMQLRRSSLPVVLPEKDGIQLQPNGDNASTVIAIVGNVGVGPAVTVALDAKFHGSNPITKGFADARRSVIAAGERSVRLVLDLETFVWRGNDWDLVLRFSDVFGNDYETTFAIVHDANKRETHISSPFMIRLDPDGSEAERIFG
jgi:hypothetical protein